MIVFILTSRHDLFFSPGVEFSRFQSCQLRATPLNSPLIRVLIYFPGRLFRIVKAPSGSLRRRFSCGDWELSDRVEFSSLVPCWDQAIFLVCRGGGIEVQGQGRAEDAVLLPIPVRISSFAPMILPLPNLISSAEGHLDPVPSS